METPRVQREELISVTDSSLEENKQQVDSVAELPIKLQSQTSGGRMKKSVSMNYSGPGGIEAAMQTPKKKLQNKKQKKKQGKNKSVKGDKSCEALCFLDLKTFKIKQ